MDDHTELGLFELVLHRCGPYDWAAIVFAAACTLWLLVTRIQGIFHLRRVSPVRDLALLSTGPITGILTSLGRAFTAGRHFMLGDRISGPPPVEYLQAGQALAFIGMAFFVIGVLACSLPSKSDANVA
jgi:hypothetical protein